MRIIIEECLITVRTERKAHVRTRLRLQPMINIDITIKMDVDRAIENLYKEGQLSKQECLMLFYVMLDGRLSRRDIFQTYRERARLLRGPAYISRRLESAYYKNLQISWV